MDALNQNIDPNLPIIDFGAAQEEQLPPFPVTPEKYIFVVKLDVSLGERRKSGTPETSEEKEPVLYIKMTHYKGGYAYNYQLNVPYDKDGNIQKLRSRQEELTKRFQHIYSVLSGRPADDRPQIKVRGWAEYFQKCFGLLTGAIDHAGNDVPEAEQKPLFEGKHFFAIIGRGRGKYSHRNEIRRYGAILEFAQEGRQSTLAKGNLEYENYEHVDPNENAGMQGGIGSVMAAPSAGVGTAVGGDAGGTDDWDNF